MRSSGQKGQNDPTLGVDVLKNTFGVRGLKLLTQNV